MITNSFAIIFLVDIFEISIVSESNVTLLGEPVCVIWYIENNFDAMEGTWRTFWNSPCSILMEPFPIAGIFESSHICILGPRERSTEVKDYLEETMSLEAPESIR